MSQSVSDVLFSSDPLHSDYTEYEYQVEGDYHNSKDEGPKDQT